MKAEGIRTGSSIMNSLLHNVHSVFLLTVKYNILILRRGGRGEFVIFLCNFFTVITAFSLNKHTSLGLVTGVSAELTTAF